MRQRASHRILGMMLYLIYLRADSVRAVLPDVDLFVLHFWSASGSRERHQYVSRNRSVAEKSAGRSSIRPSNRGRCNPLPLGPLDLIEFDNLTFQHQTASTNALDGISFTADTGETIAFVGPSGSGKTTLVKLLVGLYRPKTGDIRYDGKSINEIDLDQLRGRIGMVSQDTQLFSGTIRDNLLFVNPAATDAECLDVLNKAACHTLLARADKGLDTVIGEGGVKVSGGEKQRLSIARALLRHPKLLVFDEATSSLDSLTEEEISVTIRDVSMRKDLIAILIAHRLSTVFHADRIYVLERGQIIESGRHDELLDLKGLYYAMWRQQIGEKSNSPYSLAR